MKATVGDRIVIASNTLDRPVRSGRIVEVRHADGSPPYQVEWDDGQSALFFPGSDAHVEPAAGTPAPPVDPGTLPRHVRTWRVDVQLYETDQRTTAHAVLRTGEGAGEPLHGDGVARLRAGEPNVPEIGDEIAVGRALQQLGEVLLATASVDLTGVKASGAT